MYVLTYQCVYGETEKCKENKNKKTLTLKINLSHAICNSKTEYTFFSWYLYVTFLFFL